MNLNGGLGAVTKKNQVILPSGHNYIAPVAVKHGNGRDWWIITGEISTSNLFTFLLDPDGVHGPFLTEMPYTFPGQEYQSVNTMSPDGRTYIRCDGFHGLYIYDFDRCSGNFGELKILPFTDENFFGFATVFAPDSKHLYVSSWEGITGLDLSAPDIAATFDTLAYFDGKASPQEPFLTGFFIPNRGPDGKIYYATTNSTLSLHVMHNPDLPGIAADAEQHGIQLSKFNNGTMCIYPNYRLGEWEGAPCDTLNGQKPGDGFVKSDWYPPARVKTPGYTLLSAVGRAIPDKSERSKPHRPSMAEMAIERGKERAKEKTDNK